METKKILIADHFLASGHIPLYPMYITLKNPVHTTKVLNDMYTEIDATIKRWQSDGCVSKCGFVIENLKTGYDKYKILTFKITIQNDLYLPEKIMKYMLSSIEDYNTGNKYIEWMKYFNHDTFLPKIIKTVEVIDMPKMHRILRCGNTSLKRIFLEERGNKHIDDIFAKIMSKYVERLKNSLTKDGGNFNDLVRLNRQNLYNIYKGKEVKYTLYLEQQEYVMLS